MYRSPLFQGRKQTYGAFVAAVVCFLVLAFTFLAGVTAAAAADVVNDRVAG